ncbi:MAG: ABC transporter ATP-binding protein [Chloroflexota bacterium]|nr:ABC transporter ATP-binding protein [Chloroflexota bacterium]
MNAIEVRGLVKDYPLHRGARAMLRNPLHQPVRRVLDHVDLAVAPGEVVGVLGGNGAGKTTLLKIIATIVRPTAGDARVFGADIASAEREVRAAVAYAFSDDRSFYWRLTGRQNLEFFAAIDGLHGQRAREMLEQSAERVGIGASLDVPFSFYSSGMRQRLSLARALLRRSKILLLDEPTRSIDPVEVREIWSLIRKTLVSEEGVTVLLVTHQSQEAAAVCDRVAVLDGGQLRAQVRADELRRATEGLDGLTIGVEGLRAAALERLRAVRGVREIALSQDHGEQQLEVWCDPGGAALPELIEVMTASGAIVRSLVRSVPVSQLVARLAREGAPV